ncbi:DNA-binding protein [Marinifilum breve]|uniref:DNA-binding protein n=1 Tax=Marinifilum breve TaxID=2184082 RepID=A0A2V4A1Y5_9BACT|nr:helix-turn-helix domain-containing protein [Marinifilum breve]PXY01867.1 DNA-binding protein [Marinifilum breve]
MSSNLQIEKTCQWCKKTFVAKTTTTKYCSHSCNSKAYKAKKRREKESKYKRQNVIDYSEQSIEILKSREFLKVAEASALLGLSRQTVYNLIYSGQLKASKISPRITLIKRSDIDEMFSNAKTLQINPTSKNEKQPEFYSITEIKNKFNVGDTWAYKIIREKKIPRIKRKGKSYYSKTHVDNHFKKHLSSKTREVNDWARIDDLMKELHMTETAIYSLVSRVGIPKKRDGRHMLYSKNHILIERGLIKKEEPQYYTSEEAMLKYNISRDSLYALIKKYSIPKIKAGRYIKVAKTELDNLFNPKVD